MITKLREQQQEAGDRESVVAVVNLETEEWIEYRGDEVAEVITLPGGMVQAIDMAGERHDPVTGKIVVVSGDSWSTWVNRGGETSRYNEVQHIQENPGGEVVLVDSSTEFVGTSIRRAKRTSILDL